MKAFRQIIDGITLIGQLGFTVITPPLVLIWLAYLAQTRLGWGSWVMILAIVVGIIAAFSGAWRTIRPLLDGKKHTPHTRGKNFNEHI